MAYWCSRRLKGSMMAPFCTSPPSCTSPGSAWFQYWSGARAVTMSSTLSSGSVRGVSRGVQGRAVRCQGSSGRLAGRAPWARTGTVTAGKPSPRASRRREEESGFMEGTGGEAKEGTRPGWRRPRYAVSAEGGKANWRPEVIKRRDGLASIYPAITCNRTPEEFRPRRGFHGGEMDCRASPRTDFDFVSSPRKPRVLPSPVPARPSTPPAPTHSRR